VFILVFQVKALDASVGDATIEGTVLEVVEAEVDSLFVCVLSISYLPVTSRSSFTLFLTISEISQNV
jgi:hypothetical protein